MKKGMKTHTLTVDEMPSYNHEIIKEKWEEEKDRIFRFIPLTPQDRILIENLIRKAISEVVKEERERAEAEKNDCPGCIDC